MHWLFWGGVKLTCIGGGDVDVEATSRVETGSSLPRPFAVTAVPRPSRQPYDGMPIHDSLFSDYILRLMLRYLLSIYYQPCPMSGHGEGTHHWLWM